MDHIAALSKIETNITVGMDDLVNVFVSRYETERYAKRDEIQRQLRTIAANVANVNKAIIERVKSLYGNVQPTGTFVVSTTYTLDVDTITINKDKNFVAFTINIKHKIAEQVKLSERYGTNATCHLHLQVELSEDEVEQLTKLSDAEKEQREQLLKVNDELKSIDRKVRELKGQLAEKKLMEAGMSELLNSPVLLKIIE